ncbi:50S ribosomal protein L18 [Candidatus Dependentiae bacterium Noda2021]|nr:50S ribosomal protein L18 [Candidatus Dependentiae bacterium Noda2021]
MSLIKKIESRKKRRQLRVRSRIKSVAVHPRVSVFKSLNHIYAQIIDDSLQTTLLSCSSIELEKANKASGDKKEVAKAVGAELARKAKERGIEAVVFDRGCFLYHGRIKALADGLRDGGLQV